MSHQTFSSKSKYSFRTRRGPGRDGLSHDDLTHPAAAATVAAGLRPGILTLPAEKKRYSGNRAEYLEAREFVLLQWDEDHTRFLAEETCLKAAPEGRQRIVREVYRFLHQQGCINFGILKGDPLVPLPSGFSPEPAVNGQSVLHTDTEPAAPKPEATDKALADHLYHILKSVDLEATSEKMLRAQLAEHFGIDMSDRKGLIRDLVTSYLEAGGPPAGYKKQKAKELAEMERKRTPRKHIGRVVVVGAGPAGLTAALHLKRNNVDVVVLEARDRVGGRVNSHTAPGFDVPVDLGASIITGTEADVRHARRADPSAVLAAQLGVALHGLQSDVLPLYDAQKGEILDSVLDKEVERVRDQVMDDAAAILEGLPEAAQAGASFGGLLDEAMTRWDKRKKENVDEATAGANDVTNGEERSALVASAATSVAASTGNAGQQQPPEDNAFEQAVADISVVGEDRVALRISVVISSFSAKKQPSVATENGAQEEEKKSPSNNGDRITNGDDDGPPPSDNTLPASLTEDHLRVLSWHWANLEYGCSAPLTAVSGEHWNQDEEFGGFGGPHCMVIGGYDQIFRRVATLLDVRMSTPVTAIKTRVGVDSVEVITAGGESMWADAVVVTVPLGVLKSGTIAFDPGLPQWKQEAVARLGFGDLNKVVLQFPSVFWDDTVDFFGAVPGIDAATAANRGWCFMFWNFHRFCGAPVLAALVSGEAALEVENTDDGVLRDKAMRALRALFPAAHVPEPTSVAVSRWSSDPYARGSYSYVAVGASGDDYDQLAKPVARRILFAGEHTLKEHPDTVGGAMMSGVREAVRAIEILMGDKREGATMASHVTAAMIELKRKHGSPDHAASKRAKFIGEDRGGDEYFDYVDDEVVGEDEDDLELQVDRAMGRDVARMQEEMRRREASRIATKELWRGLLAAETGDTSILVHVWEDLGEDIAAQHNAARCLTQASGKALKVVCADKDCIQIVTGWITQAAEVSSLVALLEQLLKALLVMPLEISMLEACGLDALICKRCARHANPDIQKLARHLAHTWTEQQQIAKGFDDNSTGEGWITSRTVAPVAVAPLPVVFQLDEETKRKLELEEAEAIELESKAAQLRDQAEAQLAAMKAAGDYGAVPDTVLSFDQYKRGLKESKRKPKAKMERLSERSGPSTGGGGGGGGGGSGSGDPEDARRRLNGLISSYLKRYFNDGRVNKEQYKSILRKAVDKVMSRMPDSDLAESQKYFDKRRDHIKKLVSEYVSAYEQQKKR